MMVEFASGSNKFTFIDNYNFDEIFSIYNRTNILIKEPLANSEIINS